MLSTWPSFTNVGPRSSQTIRSRRARSCGGTSSPRRDALERPDQPLQVERRDHVLIAVPDQRRQDLAIAGQVLEMADGLAEQRRGGSPEEPVGRAPTTRAIAVPISLTVSRRRLTTPAAGGPPRRPPTGPRRTRLARGAGL